MFRLRALGLAVALAVPPAFAQPPAAAPKDDMRWLLRVAPTPLPHPRSISSVTFSADGKTVTTVSDYEAKVYLWDAVTGKLLRELRLPQNSLARSAVADGGRLLAAVDWAGRVALWDAAGGKRLRSLKGTAGPSLGLSPGGKSLVAGLAGGHLAVWDTATGQQRCRLDKSAWTAGQALAFSPDGKLIAATHHDGTVRVWDAATGKQLRSFRPARADVRLLAFTPDNRSLASCDGGGVVRFWEMGSGLERRRLSLPAGHDPTCAFFTPDGRALLTGGSDGTVRLWETSTGKQRHSFPGRGQSVTGASLAADGRSVVIAAKDNMALVREVGSQAPAAGALGAAGRPKTLQAAWDDLAHPDAARAYRAVEALTRRRGQAVAFLKERLRPAAPPDTGEAARLIRDLDNKAFAKRQKAMKGLERLGAEAEEALEAVLRGNPPLEVRRRVQQLLGEVRWQGLHPERARPLRAVEALEMIGTAEARQLVQTLAGGLAGDLLTEHAQATLARLKKTSPRPR
jgi:outer membrane protein assembly factor BamB